MVEKIKAYLCDSEGDISVDNLDFDSRQRVIQAKRDGQVFEFGKYDWRDSSVELLIGKQPEPVSPNKVQEDWEEERERYLRQSINGGRFALRGYAEGYLTEDEIQAFTYTLGFEEEERESADYSSLEEDFEEGSGRKNARVDLTSYLRDKKRVNYRLIKGTRSLAERIYRGEEWASQEFEELGFKLPEFSEAVDEVSYIVSTLDIFLESRFSGTFSRNKKSFLLGLIKDCGIDSNFVKQTKQNPWLLYEALKNTYCSMAKSQQEFDLRMKEITYVLDI